jgi:cyclophilin family peptidyl-prolyl cis-trans isomerase/HEAT repeat protein
MRYTIPFLFALTIISCKNHEKPLNKFNDPQLVKIADFQDRRSGDSLVRYLEDTNPAYRKAAALPYASVQDSAYVVHLQKLLFEDADSSVRKAAAYALGQTPSSTSETVLFESTLKEKESSVLAQVIESYGKVCKHWKLNLSAEDSVSSAAHAWANYRMAVRGLADQTLNKNSSEFLTSRHTNARLAAAHFFARGAKDFDKFQTVLIKTARQDESADVRMAAILALRKVLSDSSRRTAEFLLKNDPDYRVRVNAIRALQDYPLHQTKKILLEALRDSNINVGIAASEAIKSTVTADHWLELSNIARLQENWRIQANLYEAALAVSNHKELSEEIQSVYGRSKNPYQKAALLSALQSSLMSYGFVKEQLVTSNEPVLKISAALALVGMNTNKNFDTALRSRFAKIYEEAMANGDAAVIGIVANTLADSTLGYKSVINDFNFLKVARKKLSLPKDFESIVPLEAAIAYFEGRKISSPPTNAFNHPIPWSTVKKIPSDQKAIIKTSKGDITIRLFVDEAPGSVANFVILASNKYYDGKFFHRVVPNFVVQGGCPRGDGWGSEAYSIRSEFSQRRYNTGSIGMASAGKDTEGTQWFITHSPTPHLEGRYTIFAEVVQGMDVVHQIEVGDTIISVEIINFNVL